jgi:coronin-1B/1C/6
MSRFVRQSKVRHVYCVAGKPEEQYSNFRLSTATGDHNYIKANTQYLAVPVQSGGGALAVHPLEKVGRIDAQPPVLDGHKGPVLDFEFNPMHENIIATGGDDCTVKVWGVPPGGLTASQSEPLVDLHEHQRKITVLRFHPTAEHVLASGSADQHVKLWDVNTGASKCNILHKEMLLDVVWSLDGTMLATSSKDKMMKLCDPRSGETVAEVEAHSGTKTTKLTFLGGNNNLCSVGFTKQSKRQYKIWDPRKLAAEVTVCDLDQSAGVIMPFYDEGTNLLFLGGKGDGNIRYFELVDEAPFQFLVNDYRATSPCRGLCILPTRAMQVMKCEVVRMLKLTANTVEPLSFICPRKSDLFQADLYPDCYAGKSAMSADDFFAGKPIKKPLMMSMDPDKADKTAKPKATPAAAPVVSAMPKAAPAPAPAPASPVAADKPAAKPATPPGGSSSKSSKELQSELDKANAYIDKLVAALEKAKVKVPEP